MKTLKKTLLLTATVVLLFSCSRDYNDEAFPGSDLKAKKIAPEVFVVEPNGVDDTPALCQAFEDAKAAGPGSVVKLVEGEYHVGYMEIRDFYGSMKGAGKGKTIITVLPGIDLDELFAQHLLHCMVKFIGGDVHLSHFTMQTPPGALSTGGPGWGHIYSLLNFSSFNSVYESGNDNRSINVVIDNVCFKGQTVEEGGYPGYAGYNYNCPIGVRTGFDYYSPYMAPDPLLPREKIDLKITNCDFDTFCYALGLEGMINSKVIIGEKNKGNVFNNNDQLGGIWESRNTAVSIEGNTFNIPPYSNGFDLDDYPWYAIFENVMPEKAMVFNVQDNIFNMNHSEYALWLRNIRSRYYPEEPATVYQVKNNRFNMTDGYEWDIISLYTKGLVIRNNNFRGPGDLGFYLVNWSQGGLVLGNNFSTAEFGTAVAYLTASGINWTFVGGDIADKVIDLGSNNIYTGFNVNNSEAPFGQTIVDNLEATKDALRELKKH
ncbi:MAG: hypothetical protein P1P83_02760 [Bacteroidales bacterium]|nr:hypothetical protein [Bacteroidales bacterium]MDT8373235.1 hypothetical protein [Bacteroidales bacterium]